MLDLLFNVDPLTIGAPDNKKLDVLNPGRPWGVFKRHGLDSVIKAHSSNNGLKLNKRRPKHILQGLVTKASATVGFRA